MADIATIVNDQLTTDTVLDLLATGDINRKIVFTPADPSETAQRILERKLNAATLDELLGGDAGNVIQAKSYLGKAFQVNSIEWQVSDYEGEGLPFYVVAHITTLDGEAAVLTCGAKGVVTNLAIMAKNGWFPAWVKIVKAPKTEAGYEPLDLVKAAESDIPFAG